MPNTSHVISISDQSFHQEVIEQSHERPVVVDFWAPWCGPCKTLGPVLEDLASEGGGNWVLAKLNVDDHKRMAQKHNVRGIPAVKAFVDGEVVDEFTGAKPRAEVEKWLGRIVPTQSANELDDAWTSLEEGDLDGARDQFEDLLEGGDHVVQARVGLAKICLKEDDLQGAEQMLEAIPEGLEVKAAGRYEEAWLEIQARRADDPDTLRTRLDDDEGDLEARFELAMQFGRDGRWEDAFEQLIAIVARDREWRDELGRRAMVHLFELVDDDDRVRKWRGKLGQAMYV